MSSIASLSVPQAEYRLGRIHALLAVQSIIVILLSINRLSSLTTAYVLPNEFLRWTELNNMLILPLISVIASYWLKNELQRSAASSDSNHFWRGVFNVAFLVGVYLLAASYGTHEVTNYLHLRFCPPEETGQLCNIIRFNDDDFSHWVFFAGFVLVNVSILLLQVIYPYSRKLSLRDKSLLMVNALFIGLAIFANLAFEEIGFDLYVVALLAALSLGLMWRKGNQPLVIYYSVAYTLGLIATGVTIVM